MKIERKQKQTNSFFLFFVFLFLFLWKKSLKKKENILSSETSLSGDILVITTTNAELNMPQNIYQRILW